MTEVSESMLDRKTIEALARGKRCDMVRDMIEMSRIPSVNPAAGGPGEYKRTMWIAEKLKSWGVDYTIFEVPDERVEEGVRISLMARFAGCEDREKTLWFIAHTDTVAPGDLSLWDTDPFDPVERDGCIYGLGVEDNSQAVLCSLYTILLMKEQELRPKCNVAFLFSADEETGSAYGLKDQVKRGIFGPRDEAIVPDAGCADGSFVEITEKSHCVMDFTVTGRQAHASMPQLGINACSVGMRFAVALEDMLKERFTLCDPLYDPPYSTFELTQKFSNVASSNIIPGTDRFIMDMRVLPQIKLAEVRAAVDELIAKFSYRYKVTITCAMNGADAPAATPEDAPVVRNLLESLREAGVEARCGGIGGGTCGVILRQIGIPSVVWSTIIELAHQPNEHVVIDNLVADTGIYLATVAKYC